MISCDDNRMITKSIIKTTTATIIIMITIIITTNIESIDNITLRKTLKDIMITRVIMLIK